MRNLQEIIPAFFTGPGGARLTPEQIAARQEVAKSLMQKATDTSPNAGGWASVAAKGLMGLSAGIQEGRAERAAQANVEANQQTSNALLASLMGSTLPSSGGGWTGMAPTADVAPSPSVASALIQSPQMVANQPPVPGLQPAVTDLATGIQQSAAALGIDPVDLATVISYETGGTFDPMQKGPTTKWGQHKGLIQFGEPQAQEYGVDWNNPLGSQLGPEGAVVKYLRSNGVTPGMSLLDVYSTVNAGAPGLYDRSDAAAGGAPGTVRDKVEQQMGGHRAKAMALFAPREEGGSMGAANAMAQGGQVPGYVDPMVSAPNGRVAPTPSVEVAQALSPQPNANTGYFPPAPQAGGLDPAVIQALSDPNVSPQNKQIAMTLVQQYQGRQQAAQEQARAEALRQQEIQQRQSIAQQYGIDPSLVPVDDAWKLALEGAIQPKDRATATVNGVVIDTNTGQPIFTAPQPDPTSVQEYNFYANQAKASGQQPMDYNSWSLQKAGAEAPRSEPAPPAGYRYLRDQQGYIVSMEPIPGGPAAAEIAKNEAATTRREGGQDTASDIVQSAALKAVQALNAEGMPATGTVGRAMALFPESNAAEVRRQVNVLKANATLEGLNAMRSSSPTGAALGSVTEGEGEKLAARAGTLDPDSPNFDRDVKDYTRAVLEYIHGPEAGRKIFETMQWDGAPSPSSADQSSEAIPKGVDPEDWKFLTPEERRLFQ